MTIEAKNRSAGPDGRQRKGAKKKADRLTSIESVSDSRNVLKSGSSCKTGWLAIFCKQFSNALLLDSTKSSANRPGFQMRRKRETNARSVHSTSHPPHKREEEKSPP
jgi:hypothetical protein